MSEYILNSSMNEKYKPTNLFKTFRQELHGRFDLYENFNHLDYANTLAPGSMPSNPLLQAITKQEDPTIIVEVGSYLGYSACGMAETLKENKKDAVVICVDTWMGGLDGWKDAITDQKDYKINRKNGYPTFFYNFLANVCYAGLKDYIVPLAFPSNIASQILEETFKKIHVRADMIYIDGSHLKEDVLADLNNYLPLVKNDGLLFGDDLQCKGVQEALKVFLDQSKITSFQQIGPVHWQIRKPTQ